MKTVETEVFEFDELDDSAKAVALDWWRETGLDYEWYDCVYDDAKHVAKLMGIEIDNIWFSGFYTQGSGACFDGSYSYRKGSVRAVKEYAPKDTELHDIAETLQEVQRTALYSLEASISCNERYHSVHTEDEAIQQAMRDFASWIFQRLESEYEYLMSDEAVADTIAANGYEFTADGSIY